MSVKADPEELESFAHILSSFCETVSEETARLNGAFDSLSDSWQDAKQREFAEMLTDLTQQLNNFMEVSEQNVHYLLQQAERLRDYLSA